MRILFILDCHKYSVIYHCDTYIYIFSEHNIIKYIFTVNNDVLDSETSLWNIHMNTKIFL